jgi:DNA-binding NtrC family response regulator
MAKILIIESNENDRDHLHSFLNGLDHTVSQVASRTEAITQFESTEFDIVLVDGNMHGNDIPGLIRQLKSMRANVSIITMHADPLTIQETLGDSAGFVFRILQKPFYDAELNFQIKRALEEQSARHQNHGIATGEDEINEHSEFIGQSPAIKRIFRVLNRVAKSDSSVIVLGETGTGKELIAWTIHKQSLRAEAPFVRVNCAALPEQLLESELFGYEKGAFTGADKIRVGRFEHANGGTMFLDEVADMSLTTQSKILRVLQQKEFERLGSNLTIKTDVRIISATNKDLTAMLREGTFREDLFYRLNVITIRLPPLREREGDISLLLLYFLKHSTAKLHRHIRGFKPDAMEMLTEYQWPGNIREMENTLERAVLMAEGDMIGVEDLDLMFAHARPSPGNRKSSPVNSATAPAVTLPAGSITLREAERQLIEQAM